MNAIRNGRRYLAVLAALAVAAGVTAGYSLAQGVDRLYAMDCGTAQAPDKSRWSPGIDVAVPITLSDNCYLIHHRTGGYLLWDSGITDAVASMPDGLHGAAGAPVWYRAKTLVGQLAELGIRPGDVKLIAISHHHPDHSGNVDLFPSATLLIQKAELDFVMTLPKKPFNPARTLMKLDGDKDVFGDGSAVILSTPGHTPGHQSLLLHLAKTGTVILSGDVAHFKSNWDHRRVPGFNADKDRSLASMQRVADILAKENGVLWINHDKPQSDGLMRPPKFYE